VKRVVESARQGLVNERASWPGVGAGAIAQVHW
jgi:hypothetical protein